MPLCNCCLSNLLAPKICDKSLHNPTHHSTNRIHPEIILAPCNSDVHAPRHKRRSNAKLPLHWPRLLNPWPRPFSLLGRHCRLKRQSLSSRSRRQPKPLPEKSPEKTSLVSHLRTLCNKPTALEQDLIIRTGHDLAKSWSASAGLA